VKILPAVTIPLCFRSWMLCIICCKAKAFILRQGRVALYEPAKIPHPKSWWQKNVYLSFSTAKDRPFTRSSEWPMEESEDQPHCNLRYQLVDNLRDWLQETDWMACNKKQSLSFLYCSCAHTHTHTRFLWYVRLCSIRSG
jgi:hypothetical protein